MGCTVQALHAAVVARMATLDAPWSQSMFHAELVGLDPSTTAHKSWAVALRTVTPVAGRQAARANAVYVSTRVVVRFGAELLPMQQPESYETMLGLTQAVLLLLMAQGWATDFQLLYAGQEHGLVPTLESELQYAELRFDAYHYLDLTE